VGLRLGGKRKGNYLLVRAIKRVMENKSAGRNTSRRYKTSNIPSPKYLPATWDIAAVLKNCHHDFNHYSIKERKVGRL
jgi:hypothetical protein